MYRCLVIFDDGDVVIFIVHHGLWLVFVPFVCKRQFAEKQHTQINCITFGSLQFGHASLIRQIPSFASPCELLVSIFRSL